MLIEHAGEARQTTRTARAKPRAVASQQDSGRSYAPGSAPAAHAKKKPTGATPFQLQVSEKKKTKNAHSAASKSSVPESEIAKHAIDELDRAIGAMERALAAKVTVLDPRTDDPMRSISTNDTPRSHAPRPRAVDASILHAAGSC